MSPFQILLELRMKEVMATTGAIKHANLQSNRRNLRHKRTTIQHFTGQISFLPPSQQCQSTERKNYMDIPRICLTQAHLGVLQRYLWQLKAVVTLREGFQAVRQPSDVSTRRINTEVYLHKSSICRNIKKIIHVKLQKDRRTETYFTQSYAQNY